MDPQNNTPLDILIVNKSITARNNQELTLKKNTLVFLLPGERTDGLVFVREVTNPKDPLRRRGLVPRTSLQRQVWYRGRTLYAYQPENEFCIQVDAGEYLNVCANYVKWLLVSLDEEPIEGEPSKRIGFVDTNCIQTLDNRDLELYTGPTCSICLGSLYRKYSFECTKCRAQDEIPFIICDDCAYRRGACFIHQALSLEEHAFTRKKPSDDGDWNWLCDGCQGRVVGAKSATCQVCPRNGKEFDLCNKCYKAQGPTSHEHHLTEVSAKQIIAEVPTPANGQNHLRYRCDSCQKLISRTTVHCKTCAHPGFDLCLDCAETNRGTQVHEEANGGPPHEWEIITLGPPNIE